jgi:CRISPR-associated endonuclease/helicase Cas3
LVVAREIAEALAQHWGKADPSQYEQSGGPNHHTVLGHCLDVAACGFILLSSHPILRRSIARASALSEAALPQTIAALCCLHDVGKFDVRFARKAPFVADFLRPDTAHLQTRPYDHGTEGYRCLERDDQAYEQFAGLFGEACLPLLRAVTGHHGQLPTSDDPDPSRALLPGAITRQDVVARGHFVELTAAFFGSLGAQLPWPGVVDGAMVQRLAGLAAVADWVGSDVQHFPYRPGAIVDLSSYWAESIARAKVACASAGLVRATIGTPSFSTLFPGFAPRDVQTLTEQVPGDVASLVIIEAEMGKGKTEAALALAARLLRNGLGEGITVALPTMATSNAMFARIEAVVPKLYPNEDVQLALAHSRASRQARFTALVQRALVARDRDAPEATVSCARWLLNRKRILLAQIGVGTIDQALQASLTVRHQFVRLFGLSRNVVIIDEVHAYDAYMEVLLEHLMSWLGAMRVSVILLSATLPSGRRAALTAAWRGSGEPVNQLNAAEAAVQQYPLVTVATERGAEVLAGAMATASRMVAIDCVTTAGESDGLAEIARRLVAAAKAGARVAWIRNTVSEAQGAYRALLEVGDGVEHLLFHARFRGVDRSHLEARVLERFGKDAAPGGRVLIATQVIEQSLDLDFDALHSDLAPVDLLFQRTGRLHRHARSRPVGFEEPRLNVHLPSERDRELLHYGPSRYVYDVATLWLSGRLILDRGRFDLPNDIRPLVEAVYHPELRARLLREGPPQLLAQEAELGAKLEAKRVQARRCCIGPSDADPDGGAAMDDEDDAVHAFTRDGTSYTVLPFLWDGEAGRTLCFDDRAVPAWTLDAAHAQAWRLVHELMDQTISTFAPLRGVVPQGERAAWDAFRSAFRRFAADSGLGVRTELLPLRRDTDGFLGAAMRGERRHIVRYSLELGLEVLRAESEP